MRVMICYHIVLWNRFKQEQCQCTAWSSWWKFKHVDIVNSGQSAECWAEDKARGIWTGYMSATGTAASGNLATVIQSAVLLDQIYKFWCVKHPSVLMRTMESLYSSVQPLTDTASLCHMILCFLYLVIRMLHEPTGMSLWVWHCTSWAERWHCECLLAQTFGL